MWFTTFLLAAYDWTILSAVCFSRAVSTFPESSIFWSVTFAWRESALKVGSLVSAFWIWLLSSESLTAGFPSCVAGVAGAWTEGFKVPLGVTGPVPLGAVFCAGVPAPVCAPLPTFVFCVPEVTGVWAVSALWPEAADGDAGAGEVLGV